MLLPARCKSSAGTSHVRVQTRSGAQQQRPLMLLPAVKQMSSSGTASTPPTPALLSAPNGLILLTYCRGWRRGVWGLARIYSLHIREGKDPSRESHQHGLRQEKQPSPPLLSGASLAPSAERVAGPCTWAGSSRARAGGGAEEGAGGQLKTRTEREGDASIARSQPGQPHHRRSQTGPVPAACSSPAP